MSDELKSTQIVYGENVLMMRVDDCLIFGNKNAMRSLAEKLTELPSAEPKRKKGRWEVQPSTGDDRPFIWWKCSECGHVIFSETERDRREFHAFCGRCGAEMTRGE